MIFAEQWYDPMDFEQLYQRFEMQPEIMLLQAVLGRGIRDAYGECWLVSPVDKRNAQRWIHSDDNSAFSFMWICEHLELNAELLRKLIPVSNWPFRDADVSGMGDIWITP